MKRIQEGIHQIVTPFPEFERAEAYRLREDLETHPRVTRSLPYVLPYFIASRGETALVDCGWNTDDAREALDEQLSEAGAGIGDIQTLVLTHAHPDHCGLAGRLKDESGCAIWMHDLESPFLESRYVAPEELLDRMDEWFGRHGVDPIDREEIERGSMPMRFFVARFQPDRPLQGGEMLKVGDFAFQLIWTPGHSPGHICLYEPNHQLLLSGDHVLPRITPNISLHPQQRPNPLADFLQSLETVAKLKVKRLLPAHEWDIAWFQRRIAELLAHHVERLEEMLAVVRGGEAMTAVEVARSVTWATGSYDSFIGWMKRAAIGETLSHLVYLAHEGRLAQFEEDGLVRFRAA
ncbi:MAG: MBL fold metallo-hydrolase [Dehalococcoidia bacterium]|nr:MBL fold metallo-hydrolase [Dehalococcoidia bacterium]